VSGCVALRLVLPEVVVTWFVTGFRIRRRPANVPASRQTHPRFHVMNRVRLSGERRWSAVVGAPTVRSGLRPDAVAGHMLWARHYERYGLYGITSGSGDGFMRLSPGQNGPEAVNLAI
jgi:hypothetical protein